MTNKNRLKNILMGLTLLVLIATAYFLDMAYLDFLNEGAAPAEHLGATTRLVIYASMAILLVLVLVLIPRAAASQSFGGVDELRSILNKGIRIAEETGDYGDEEIRTLESLDLTKPKGVRSAYAFLEEMVESAHEDRQNATESSNAKSLFLANMSHEIRTPMNGVIGFIELLKSTEITKEQEEFIDVIDKSSQNLLGIINNILDLSRIESDNVEIEDIPFDAFEVFEGAIESAAKVAAEKNLELNYSIDMRIHSQLKGDSGKIVEVANHLLSNAIKFTNPGGQVNVSVQRLDSKNGQSLIQFGVSDTGIGMSPSQLAHIFKPFTQADLDMTRKYGGTGLGLTISQQYAERMGGKIEVNSKKGQGSTFTFTLLLEEVPTTEGSLQNRFANTAIGQYTQEVPSDMDKTLTSYLHFLGAETEAFSTMPQLKQLLKEKPDMMLIVDESHAPKEIVDALDHIDPHQVILISDFIKSKEKTEGTIYKPLTPKKLVRTLRYKINFEAVAEEPTIDIAKTTYNAHALIAEDNAINQRLIQNILQGMGLTADVANNGQEALEKRKTGAYDIVFMDIQMPVMDGVEATHAILKHEKENDIPHVPIVALTANALKGDRERFLNEGLDEYVAKPIEMNELFYVLNKFLSGKSKIKTGPSSQTPRIMPTFGTVTTKPDAQQSPSSTSASAQKQEKSSDNSSVSQAHEKRKILIAKHSKLSSKIIARMMENLQYSFDIVDDQVSFDHRVAEDDYWAIFTDVAFLSETSHPVLSAKKTHVVLSDLPESPEELDGLNYHKVNSVLSLDAVETILNRLG